MRAIETFRAALGPHEYLERILILPPHEDGEETARAALSEPKSTFPSAGTTIPDVLECAMGVLAGIRADPGGGTYHMMKNPAMKTITITTNMIHMQPQPSPPLWTGAVFS